MLKTEREAKKNHRDKNYYQAPVSTQAIIPFESCFEDGMFLSNGGIYTKTYQFSDVNYSIADRTEQEDLIRALRSVAKSCTTAEYSQYTIINRHINKELLEELYLKEKKTDWITTVMS